MRKEEEFLAKGATFANIVLVSAGVVCLLALSYFAYHYAWTRDRQFASWVGVLLYYVFPALLAASSFVSLRLRVPLKLSLALLLCSASASIIALETLLNLWFNLPSVIQSLDRKLRVQSAKAAGVDF